MDTELLQASWGWLKIWRMAFLRPTIRTFSQIVDDRKASIGWGVLWMALAACAAWLLGPFRLLVWGWLMNNFGIASGRLVTGVGTVVAVLAGVTALLLDSALAHGLALLFRGQGTFRRLVYGWGATALPFVLVAGLVLSLPLPLNYGSGQTVSRLAIAVTIARLGIAAAVMLYLAYAQLVALAAAERFSRWKALGVLVLLGLLLGLASSGLQAALRALLMRALMY